MNADTSGIVEPGAHTDLTTLMGTAELLWRVGDPSAGPVTFDILFSFVQFIENLVLQDRLLYEKGSTPGTEELTYVIENSSLIEHVGKELLLPHANPNTTDTNRCIALNWAIGAISTVDLAALRHAVVSRVDCYHIMESLVGIRDSKNPIYEEDISGALMCGGEELRASYSKALDDLAANRIGPLGIHILMRIHGLHDWIGTTRAITYAPHFSRIPLVHANFADRRRSVEFRRWSIEEIRAFRAKTLRGVVHDDDESRLNLQLSPIFLACIPGAKSAVDVIHNALGLRHSAVSLRKECRKQEEAMRAGGMCRDVDMRRLLQTALSDLDDHLRGVTTTTTAKRIGLSFTGPKMEIEFQRTTVEGQDSAGVAFLTSTLRTSLSVLDARKALETIFGVLPRFDMALLESVGARHEGG